MCRCSEAELNCVSRKIRTKPELMQFGIGMSTIRYLPPMGTAGFARSFVSGNKRAPLPPPRMTDRTLCAPKFVKRWFMPREKEQYARRRHPGVGDRPAQEQLTPLLLIAFFKG